MTTRRMIEAGAVAAVMAMAGGRVAAKPPAETVHLEVNGGAWAGTYDATSTGGGCSADAKGPGSWSNELYVSSAITPNELVNLPLIVPDAKAAASGTAEFYLAVGFGPLAKRLGTTYQMEIETRKGHKDQLGSGTVTVDDKGETAVVTFDVTSARSEHLKGTITCNSVARKK